MSQGPKLGCIGSVLLVLLIFGLLQAAGVGENAALYIAVLVLIVAVPVAYGFATARRQ
jgi:cation transport ATPase